MSIVPSPTYVGALSEHRDRMSWTRNLWVRNNAFSGGRSKNEGGIIKCGNIQMESKLLATGPQIGTNSGSNLTIQNVLTQLCYNSEKDDILGFFKSFIRFVNLLITHAWYLLISDLITGISWSCKPILWLQSCFAKKVMIIICINARLCPHLLLFFFSIMLSN